MPGEVLKQARDAHDTAHISWEWWTAENSDGFHNPTAARESLARSITTSQDAMRSLDKALADLRAKKERVKRGTAVRTPFEAWAGAIERSGGKP